MKTISQKAEELVNIDRQNVYGHPFDDFSRVEILTKVIMESDLDPKIKHPLYMIQVKIARLIETPDHKDSLVDIPGYATTLDMILDEMKKRNLPLKVKK